MKNTKQLDINMIHSELINYSDTIDDLGIMNGKMGFAIYYYLMGRALGDSNLIKIAEKYIDDICDSIIDLQLVDFDSGLLGIGTGLEFLSQKSFLNINTNKVLFDFDIRLLKYLTNNQKKSIDIDKGLIGYLIYILYRLKSNNSNNSNNIQLELCNELCIIIVNEIVENFENDNYFVFNDARFDSFSNLAFFIRLTTELIKLKQCSGQIGQTVSQFILSRENMYPSLSINRLHFATELIYFTEIYPNQNIVKYLESLLLMIDTRKIINEIDVNNSGFRFGLSGLRNLLHRFKNSSYDSIEKSKLTTDLNLITLPNNDFVIDKKINENKLYGLSQGYISTLLYEFVCDEKKIF